MLCSVNIYGGRDHIMRTSKNMIVIQVQYLFHSLFKKQKKISKKMQKMCGNNIISSNNIISNEYLESDFFIFILFHDYTNLYNNILFK